MTTRVTIVTFGGGVEVFEDFGAKEARNMDERQVFFTADTHFGHRRIIDLSRRPFADVVEMREALITSWNAVVRPGDTVWHLGDFAYRSGEHPKGFFDRLHGEKHLVVGNHDGEATLGLPWASVQQMAQVVVDGSRIHLCHYPLLEWQGFHRGALHLFGHVHGTRPGVPGSLDVGVDCWGFAPASLPAIRRRLADLAAAETADAEPAEGCSP